MIWLTLSTIVRATPAEMSFSDVSRRYQRLVGGPPGHQGGSGLAPLGRSDHDLSERCHTRRDHEGDRAEAAQRCPSSRSADDMAGTATARPQRQNPIDQRFGRTRVGTTSRRTAAWYG